MSSEVETSLTVNNEDAGVDELYELITRGSSVAAVYSSRRSGAKADDRRIRKLGARRAPLQKERGNDELVMSSPSTPLRARNDRNLGGAV